MWVIFRSGEYDDQGYSAPLLTLRAVAEGGMPLKLESKLHVSTPIPREVEKHRGRDAFCWAAE